MPSIEQVARTNAGLAAELRVSVMRLRRRLMGERHPDNELSLSAMSALGFLHRNGELTQSALAQLERVQPPSMNRTVKWLAEQGYVSRRPHESDGRQVLVSITDRGCAVIAADRARRDAWLSRRLAALTADEREVLRRAAPILQRLAQGD